jgi:hypothetical protein
MSELGLPYLDQFFQLARSSPQPMGCFGYNMFNLVVSTLFIYRTQVSKCP